MKITRNLKNYIKNSKYFTSLYILNNNTKKVMLIIVEKSKREFNLYRPKNAVKHLCWEFREKFRKVLGVRSASVDGHQKDVRGPFGRCSKRFSRKAATRRPYVVAMIRACDRGIRKTETESGPKTKSSSSTRSRRSFFH